MRHLAPDAPRDAEIEGASTGAGRSAARTTGDLVRTAVRGVGQTLITAGVVLLLFVVYELYVTNLFAAHDQHKLNNDLAVTWAKPAPVPVAPGIGDAFARIYAPDIGLGMGHTPLVVVEGTGTADLKKGPGHLAGTALPGQVGNLVISGHRTTYGAPFNKLDKLDPGDEIIVETATTYFTYRMTARQVVSPSAIEVTYPVPGANGATPTKRLITLTTCNPKYSARQRLVIRGELLTTVPKAGGARPPALRDL